MSSPHTIDRTRRNDRQVKRHGKMYLRSGAPARWGEHRDGRRTRLRGVETRAQSDTLLSSGQISDHEEITVILIEATDGTPPRSFGCIGRYAPQQPPPRTNLL